MELNSCTICGYELRKNGKCKTCQTNDQWETVDKEVWLYRLFPKRIAKALLILDIKPDKHWVDKILQEEDMQNGLFFYGKTGTGKTLSACATLLEAKRRTYVYPDLKPIRKIEFITTLDLLESIRKSFGVSEKRDEDEQYKPKTTSELIEHYTNLDILILDDFGSETPTDWSIQLLRMIINHRYNEILPTIITCNKELGDLSVQLQDDRIPSRIYEMCKLIPFEDKKDYRLKAGK